MAFMSDSLWEEFSDSAGLDSAGPPPRGFSLFEGPNKDATDLGKAAGFAAELRAELVEIEMPDKVAGVRLGSMRRAILSTWTGEKLCLHRGQTKR
jgi:hypothetical protein